MIVVANGMQAVTRGFFPYLQTAAKEVAVSNVRLCSADDSYVIAVDFWSEVLDWAQDNGWEPEHEPLCYRGEYEVEVSSEDASNLADALEFIAGDIVLHEYEVSDKFLRHLLDSLLKLTLFFQSGEFRIVPASGIAHQ